MFNKIKKNMNINSNKTNKIMILLSLFLILLNESNNIVYATDIKDIKNGQLNITSKGITYEYDGIEETKIRIVNERKFFIYFNEEEKEDEEVNYKSIKLSEEIIKSISGNDETEVTLNYGYFLNGEKVLEINTETVLNEGLLVTGNYNNKYNIISIIKDGKLTVGNDSNNENSLFGIVGIFANHRNPLFYNKGTTTINTENTLILSNMFISYPHNYHFYLLSNYKEILTINSKNINIINNILHLEEKMLVMFYNFGTLNLGSENTETITIENNRIINNYYNSYLFYNETERDTNRTKTISKIDAENIYISNNILISAIEEAILFTTNLVNFNYELLNLGSNKTKTITIKDNKIKACLDSFLFNKISSITLISEEINFTNNNL